MVRWILWFVYPALSEINDLCSDLQPGVDLLLLISGEAVRPFYHDPFSTLYLLYIHKGNIGPTLGLK